MHTDHRSLIGLVIVLGCVGVATAAERVPGDLWETTVQMSMEGMESVNMPPSTNRMCQPRNAEWTEPPGASQDTNCEAVNWNHTGSKATWTIRCKDGTTGTGEMVFEGKDAYKGTVTVQSSHGKMAMKMSGKRVGDCDAAETQRQVAAVKKQAEEGAAAQQRAIVNMCKESASAMAVTMFLPPDGICASPEDKAALCANYRTEKGWSAVAGHPPYQNPQLEQVESFCGVEAEAVRSELCTAALSNRSYRFLADHCPGQQKQLADTECAGRKFTAIPDPELRGFCMTYATEAMSAGNQPAEPKEDAKSKTKKALKGLFGR